MCQETTMTEDHTDHTDQTDQATTLSKMEKQKQFGEVFTPPTLVSEILDQLPPELWQDPHKTWLDNSCGDGAFLTQVKERLMAGLAEWEPDAIKREQHILNNQIYGVELQTDNWIKCRINLGLTPTGNDGNIVNTDALTYNYTFIKDDRGGYKIEDSTFEDMFTF
jgi:type I restriction-modification system DNA methylase subunit